MFLRSRCSVKFKSLPRLTQASSVGAALIDHLNMSIPKSSIQQCIVSDDIESVLQVFEGPFQPIYGKQHDLMFRPEIALVGSAIDDGFLRHDTAFMESELQLQGLQNRARDLFLNVEHIIEHAGILLRPEMCIVCCIDQLRRDAETVPRFPYAPLQNVSHVDFSGDLRNLLFRPFECHRRAARNDKKVMDMGQIRDDLFCETVTEIFIVLAGAEIFKG